MPRDYDDENLPTVPSIDNTTLEIPIITNVGIKPAETEVLKEDVAIATMQLQGVMAAWASEELTVARMLKLVDGTIKAVKFRRDVLGLPYGFIDKGPRNVSFEVPD